jgi:hypothetical protein
MMFDMNTALVMTNSLCFGVLLRKQASATQQHKSITNTQKLSYPAIFPPLH